jgi:hypothetical protein
MQTQDTRDLLERFGYTFVIKEGDWVRCAVSGHGEQWLGKGLDEDTAFQDACNQMFPSSASRTLLERALAPNPVAERDDTIVIPDEPQAPTESLAAVLSRGNQTSAEPEPEIVVDPPGVVGDFKPEVTEHEVVDLETREVVGSTTTVTVPTPPQKVYISPEEPEEEEPAYTREEALELIQTLQDEMDDNYDEVAIMSSQYQRLHISSWIFRGRAVQENFPGDKGIEEAVHRVARRLTDWCKVFWPGSIRALQVYTQPTQSLDGLMRYTDRPKTWGDAAEMIERYMEDLLVGTNRDDYGWTDLRYLKPQPPNPEALLREVQNKLVPVIGPLGGPLDDKRKAVPGSTIESYVEDLVMAAHLLRWCRRTADPVQWGITMGAMRWASRQSRVGLDTLKKLLEDEHRPTDNWASLLGRDPEINRKNLLRKKVMSSMPTKDWLEEDLMSWLQNAFQVFTNPQIAKLGEAVSAEIMEFTNADFADADRNARSRLRKLQSIFRGRTVDLKKVDLPTDAELEVSEDLTADEASPRKVIDPSQVILEKVQKITEGKSILFVTNRPEQKLHRDLERDLKAKVHYKVGDTARTMKPIIKGVSASRYDMVLMATGFNNHSADAALSRATKAEGLPYIRVQKGRLASTIRAIGRAFNVSGQGKDADEATVAHAG